MSDNNHTKSLKCIIVDDERGAHMVLQHYIMQIDRLELMGSCENALEAINLMHNIKVDLMFLDINMPQMNGLELLSTLKSKPLVIFTTAHSDYALESYTYDVVDYLLKPIQFTRFLKAIDKAFYHYGLGLPDKTINIPPSAQYETSIVIRVDGDWLRIEMEEIKYAQSWGNYVKIFTDTQIYLTALTLSELDQRLPNSQFIRVHKSYLVSIKRITRISGNALYINDISLPVGLTYRRELIEHFK
ncbi:LytTR family DNA-binding domain-containing protein [Emticicia sp. BO119]|uniref:LytR/AlgR family response regulator transcription factor n=1 Tax=Emticicia sp. BO119 TaxID=2757768 RepID=UPI0015F0397E|nr:LytTR family DNA-binding domain-containing protein [Emticicia sp. BO119]MBA4849413.1 response regulator transcription factor [Emticicia sp. BO119]